MAKITMITVLIPCIALLAVSFLCAEETSAGGDELREMRRQILELRQKLLEMEKRHAAEIEALKAKIGHLRPEEGVGEEEAELDALRRLAEGEAEEQPPAEERAEEIIYKSGALSLQSLNVE